MYTKKRLGFLRRKIQTLTFASRCSKTSYYFMKSNNGIIWFHTQHHIICTACKMLSHILLYTKASPLILFRLTPHKSLMLLAFLHFPVIKQISSSKSSKTLPKSSLDWQRNTYLERTRKKGVRYLSSTPLYNNSCQVTHALWPKDVLLARFSLVP